MGNRNIHGFAGTDPGSGNGNGVGPASENGYRHPPQEIVDIVDAPPEPLLSFSPDRTKARTRRSE